MQNKLTWLALVAATVSATALAEDKPAPKGWTGEVGLSYIESAGNSKSTSFNGKSKAVRDIEHWRYTLKLEGDNESADNVRSAESYFASGKADYKLNQTSYLFGLLEHTIDRYSGYDYESSLTFGYGRDLINTDRHKLSADAGLGYRRSKVTNSHDVEEGVVRLGAQYNWNINDHTKFGEEASTEMGKDKTVSKSLTSVKVKINGNLWGSVALELKRTSSVPPGVKNTDRTTTIGLNYTF